MFVEPTNVCNLRCGICPESLPDYGEQAGYYQRMPMSTWARIVQSLRGWCRLKVMRLYNTGEPLLNRFLPNMIEQSHTISDQVEVTTNGTLLDMDASIDLVEAKLDYLRVSVYGTDRETFKAETGRHGDPVDVVENVKALRFIRGQRGAPHIHAELVTTQPGQESLFHEQWDGIADTTAVKPIHNWGRSFVQLGAAPPRPKIVCPYPFYQLAVKANGEVTVCCADWANELSVGNVNRESLRDIWNGEHLRNLQQMHLDGRRGELAPCRDCNVLHTCPDDIDSLAEA